MAGVVSRNASKPTRFVTLRATQEDILHENENDACFL
jgi:hypothetical protein